MQPFVGNKKLKKYIALSFFLQVSVPMLRIAWYSDQKFRFYEKDFTKFAMASAAKNWQQNNMAAR